MQMYLSVAIICRKTSTTSKKFTHLYCGFRVKKVNGLLPKIPHKICNAIINIVNNF
jgi:hypothetical protein